MGLYNKLVTQNSDLRSTSRELGNPDLPGVAVGSPIPDYPEGNNNFLLRSGTLRRQALDTERITDYLFSAEGLLFTAKQNLLSRSGVKTEASGIINEGPYLPDNTILQVSQAGIGGHSPKNGLDNGIVGGIAALAGLDVPGKLPQYTEAVTNIQGNDDNRLVQLLGGKITEQTEGQTRFERAIAAFQDGRGDGIFNRIGAAAEILLQTGDLVSPDPNEILRYGGGPGAELGIGETVIGRYTNTSLAAQIAYNPEIETQLGSETSINQLSEDKLTNSVLTPGFVEQIQSATGINVNPGKIRDGVRTAKKLFSAGERLANSFRGALSGNSLEGVMDQVDNVEDNPESTPEGSPSYTLTPDQIRRSAITSTENRHSIQQDFRRNIDGYEDAPAKILGKSLSYTDPASQIDTRVNHGTPGDNNRAAEEDSITSTPLDKINFLPLYQSTTGIATADPIKNDLVKFRIAAIDTENPANSVYMHFRAFITDFNDSYNAEWNARKYMGRGENFYKYNGFDRSISMGWRVVAQSQAELIQMYTKLNFLASNLAPDYTTSGYMGGPLVRLSVGGYVLEQHGFIESLSYSVPENSPWELGIARTGTDNTAIGGTRSENDDLKELPLYIDVTNFSFKPIHQFAPEKQKNQYSGGDLTDTNGDHGAFVSSYGLQRYIALSNYAAVNSGESNYDRNLPIYKNLQTVDPPQVEAVSAITNTNPVSSLSTLQASSDKTRESFAIQKNDITNQIKPLTRNG